MIYHHGSSRLERNIIVKYNLSSKATFDLECNKVPKTDGRPPPLITSEGQSSCGVLVPDRSQNTAEESSEEEPDVGGRVGLLSVSVSHRDRLRPQMRGIKEGGLLNLSCRACRQQIRLPFCIREVELFLGFSSRFYSTHPKGED